jgi:hypothetical protein
MFPATRILTVPGTSPKFALTFHDLCSREESQSSAALAQALLLTVVLCREYLQRLLPSSQIEQYRRETEGYAPIEVTNH